MTFTGEAEYLAALCHVELYRVARLFASSPLSCARWVVSPSIRALYAPLAGEQGVNPL